MRPRLKSRSGRTATAAPASGRDAQPFMTTLNEFSRCVAQYDPHALPVPAAQAIVRQWAAPVTAVERVALRDALDRVLAADIVSPIDVPSHDNSAMDGYAFNRAALATSAVHRRIWRSSARRWPGIRSRAASTPRNACAS